MTGWKDIKSALESLRSVEDVQRLFIEKLNFEYADEEANKTDFAPRIRDEITRTRIIASKENFKIILCKIGALVKKIERPAVQAISRYYLNNLIVFTDRKEDEFHFINTKYIEKDKEKRVRGFRRITVGKTDRLRTAAERLSMIYAREGISSLDLQSRCEQAFDVEAVTKEFYWVFVETYKGLRKTILQENNIHEEKADEFTQNILNRLLFLYFIQKKRWLKGDYRFLYHNLQSLDHKSGKNYYRDFLLPLFKKLSLRDFHHADFEDIPFLNGGLFKFNQTEEEIKIPNQVFEEIFDELLERFNFTVREDDEYEQEVAIDPEMLGKIFENLVLAIESQKYTDIPDVRRASGSYYTPRFIVTFMAKESLLEYLTGEFPSIERKKIKSLIFEEESKLGDIDNDKLRSIREKILDLKIVDPGIGSGAFAVDVLSRVVNLVEKINDALGEATDRYELRKKLIENSIYGVDIQPRAIHLAHLRLWLSLVVDIQTKDAKDILPLINLDFKVVEGNSLISEIFGYPFDVDIVNTAGRKTPEKIIGTLSKFRELKIKYAETFEEPKRQRLKEEIEKKKREIAIWYLTQIKRKKMQALLGVEGQLELFKKPEQLSLFRKTEQERQTIKEEIEDIEAKILEIKTGKKIDSFNWWLDFFEVMGVKGGFDIVTGNPPYGISEPQKVAKGEFGLGSNDSYGVFTALGVKILKPGGILCFIMSDTYQTIRTHRKLRDKLLKETELKYLISVPPKTFRATVNPGIYLFKKSLRNEEKNNFVLAADFHNLSIKNGDLEAGFEILVEENSFDETKDSYTIMSDKEMAIYAYRQKLIKRFSNLSFFIASPKLFRLMDDTTNVTILKEPPVIKVDFNDKEIELLKFGDIAESFGGVKSYQNFHKHYMRINTESKFSKVDPNLIIKRDLSEIEKQKGVKRQNEQTPIFVKMMKFGKHIKNDRILNYYVPIEHFYEWTTGSVRILENHNCLRNKDLYFGKGIFFSVAGSYAPCFRYAEYGVFDINAHLMKVKEPYSEDFEEMCVLGWLCAKFSKYVLKNFVNHTAGTNTQDIDLLVFNMDREARTKIGKLTKEIVEQLGRNDQYDYVTKEQVEIDKIVYRSYNLNDDDIEEVENWYSRRYPTLAKTIETKSN